MQCRDVCVDGFGMEGVANAGECTCYCLYRLFLIISFIDKTTMQFVMSSPDARSHDHTLDHMIIP